MTQQQGQRSGARNVQISQTRVARHYRLANVRGFSRRSIDLHLDLYRAHIDSVNELRHSGEPDAAARLLSELNEVRLHELFFEQLDGRPSGAPPASGSLLVQTMDVSFGGVDAWRTALQTLAGARGAGWVVSCLQAATHRLTNIWMPELHIGIPVGLTPVAVFDVCEHAYLPDFRVHSCADYIGAVIRNTDWSVLERRCIRAAKPVS
jgi:superoxide dismutase